MLLLWLTACVLKNPSSTQPTLDQKSSKAVIMAHTKRAQDMWQAAFQDAQELDQKIQTFAAEPSEVTLKTARIAWRKARDSYSQTEALRFQNGPIDHPESGVEGLLNAWPMDEAFVDYVKDKADAGIINQTKLYPTISKELLVSLNEKQGEESISVGYHAVEFLLWGQDFSATGPGNRPFTDYTTAPNYERRKQYLVITSKLITNHLKQVNDQWKAGPDSHPQKMLKDMQNTITGIWTGIAMLAGDEMAGERMGVAFETAEQEDEQSCFSDHSLQDLIANLKGIRHIYEGTKEQPGLSLLVGQKDPQVDQEIKTQLAASQKALEDLPQPYDQLILAAKKSPKHQAMEQAITGLTTLSDLLVKGARLSGTPISLKGSGE